VGVLEVEGEPIQLQEGGAVFVRAGAEHRFSAYERLAVLVLFDKSQT
jgi:quercetin dioxygenase-like cupin family protein